MPIIMKKLLTILFAVALGLNLSAQTDYVDDWNPDADGDDLIGITDLLALLSLFAEADSDGDGIWDSVDDCIGVNDPCGVCNGTGEDVDEDGLCDDVDDCVGEYDECGVCNGSGPSIPIVDDIIYATDSVFIEQLDEWFVFEYATDTLFTLVCPGIGCTDEEAANYDPEAVIEGGTCEFIGCMDTAAANYDPTATQESEGSCTYCDLGSFLMNVEMYDLGGDGWNGANYYLESIDGTFAASGNLDEADLVIDGVGTDFHCRPPGCYLFTSGGGQADAEIATIITDQFGTLYVDQVASGSYGPLPPPYGFPSGGWFVDFTLTGGCDFEGCTSPSALNYNISATVNDGSCLTPPDNDAIENSEAVNCGASVSGTLELAQDDEDLIGTFAGTEEVTTGGVWYKFNADADYQVFANLCDTPAPGNGWPDPVSWSHLHVFIYNDDGELEGIAGTDGGCPSGLPALDFIALAGLDYYIHVSQASIFSRGNDFLLNVTCEPF